MPELPPLVDVHCHLLPGIDDGAADLETALAMAQLAVADGIDTVVVTPHQQGAFHRNDGATIRARTEEFAAALAAHEIPLRVLPGADVRIEPELVRGVLSGQIVSLGDHRRHVLLELPHELYLPLEGLLDDLASARMTGVLSHPERNLGILQRPEVLRPLVEAGCLMQVTAGSLLGAFGPRIEAFSIWLLKQGLIHLVASDAHGLTSRRPLLSPAHRRIAALTDEATAERLCSTVPLAIAEGRAVTVAQASPAGPPRHRRWLGLRRAA